jgi:drug/metabolite transporter (DMT)-like permease
MIGALLSFSGMAVSGRELSADLGTFEILFLRSAVGLVIVAVILSRDGWAQVRTAKPGLHVLRNLAHYGGQFGWFYGLALIPLAQVFAIEFTLPIWVAILAIPILGERMSAGRVWAIALGFLGVLVILRPGFEIVTIGALAVFAAAFCYAVSHTLTRKLAGTETPMSILFYMTVIQLPLGLFPALSNWVWPKLADWPWVVVVGVTALSAHYCMARALKLAEATVVVTLDFMRLPLIMVVGLALYGEALDPWIIIGAGIIFVGVYVNLRDAEKRRVA